jgi:hypothetical protein
MHRTRGLEHRSHFDSAMPPRFSSEQCRTLYPQCLSRPLARGAPPTPDVSSPTREPRGIALDIVTISVNILFFTCVLPFPPHSFTALQRPPRPVFAFPRPMSRLHVGLAVCLSLLEPRYSINDTSYTYRRAPAISIQEMSSFKVCSSSSYLA